MADSKITALTSISTSTDPANDPLVIVDVSDTSMAATGTTKKVTLNNLLACSPTAGGNFTITGDLTVDTSTLKVDSANNRVGIGTASPSVALDVVGAARFVAAAAGPKLSIENAGGSTRFKSTDTSSFYYSAYDHNFTNTDGSVNRYTIDNNGVSTWYVSGSTAMTLNSTGLGVGTSPTAKLDVAGNARVQLAFFTGGTIPGLTNENPFAYRVPGGGLGLGAATETSTTSPIIFYTGQGGVERVRVKGAGQVRFFPLASDPAGAEAGDVYYNSTSNKLKCYNGTTWNDLF